MDRDDMLKQWRVEAKKWILAEGEAFIESLHRGSTSNPEVTVGQVVAHLDTLPPVPGYELLRHEKALRYQVVRSVIESAAREGKFDVGSTTNSRGRESKCFSPAGWSPERRRRRPSYSVEVDSAHSEQDAAKLREWLEKNDIAIDSLFIQRVV